MYYYWTEGEPSQIKAASISACPCYLSCLQVILPIPSRRCHWPSPSPPASRLYLRHSNRPRLSFLPSQLTMSWGHRHPASSAVPLSMFPSNCTNKIWRGKCDRVSHHNTIHDLSFLQPSTPQADILLPVWWIRLPAALYVHVISPLQDLIVS